MVVLISGASHTGKTLLAQRLTKRHGWFCLSLDLLKMGFIRSGMTTLTPEDDDRLTGLLWPVAREMVKTAIENRQNLIVEGCYIPVSYTHLHRQRRRARAEDAARHNPQLRRGSARAHSRG